MKSFFIGTTFVNSLTPILPQEFSFFSKLFNRFIFNRKPSIRPLEKHAARKEKNHGGKNCALQPWASVRLQHWSIIKQVNGS